MLPRPDHELVPFAVFLDYRARRLRAPVVGGTVPTPDGPTRPADPPPPADGVIAMVIPITLRR